VAYNEPKGVRAPRDRWVLIDVLVDHGKGQHALAIGEWRGGGPAHDQRVFAMRWNGDDNYAGHPTSRGIATWFIVPSTYNSALLEELPEEKKVLATALLEK